MNEVFHYKKFPVNVLKISHGSPVLLKIQYNKKISSTKDGYQLDSHRMKTDIKPIGKYFGKLL